MNKILLPKNNSIWGVIINPQSSNTYRHALSFDTKQLKEQFIGQELFGSSSYDWKAELDKQPSISIPEQDGKNITVRVQREQYPNYSFDELLNKDFLILLTELNGTKKYKYYAISSATVKGQIIEYKAELDIFFTYDVKDMFNDKPIKINQAMYDRYKKENNTIIPNFNGDFYLPLGTADQRKTPLYNNEMFDNLANGTAVLNGDILKPIPTQLKIVKANGDDYTAEQAKPLLEHILNIKWDILGYSSFDDNAASVTLYNNVVIPYFVCAFPVLKTKKPNEQEDKHNFNEVHVSIFTDDTYTTQQTTQRIDLTKEDMYKVITHPQSIKSFRYLSPLPPFWNLIRSGNQGRVRIDGRKLYFEIVLVTDDKATLGLIQIPNVSRHSVSFENFYTYFWNLPPLKFIDKVFPNPPQNINDINQLKNIDNEIKLNFYPYKFFRYSNGTANYFDIEPQYLFDNTLTTYNDFAYLSETWNMNTIIQFYKTNQDIDAMKQYEQQDNYFKDYMSYSLPTSTSAWSNYLQENQAQQTAGWLNRGIGVISGLGIAAATGGIGAAVGLSIAAKSVTDISSQIAQYKDIKNTPNTTQNTGSTLLIDNGIKNLNLTVSEYKILPIHQELVFQHFYQFGYNYNGLLFNINNLLKTRYYFNFIEAPETFENISLQANADIKQIINDTLAKGLTIWHVRDLTTFKGIKNYDYENVEMSII